MKKLVLILALSLIPSVAMGSTFLQFNQVLFNTPWNIVNGTTITATNVQVNVNFDEGFCLVVGCGGVTDGVFLLNFSATDTGAAVNNAGIISQDFAGFISFTSLIGGINLLTVNFSDELSGSAGGSNPTLNSSQPPDIFTGSSDVFDPLKLGVPRGFALSFSNWFPGLSIVGGNIGSATADATGTFNAQNVIPEPASLILVGLGLMTISRRMRSIK
jgi:hypothetical protein